jgi:hypothetical protein
MSSKRKESMTKNFAYSFMNEMGLSVSLSVAVPIPLPAAVNFREMGYRIIESERVPCFAEDGLILSLKEFVEDETEKEEDRVFDEIQRQFFEKSESERQDVVKEVNALFRERSSAQTERSTAVDENKTGFSEMYHKLIHSGFLTEPLVTLEHSYSVAVADLVSSRDQAVNELIQRQSLEMEKMIKRVGVGVTDDDVNILSVKHFEESENLRNQWDQTISDLKFTQRCEFKDWISKVFEDYEKGDTEYIVSRIRSHTGSSASSHCKEEEKLGSGWGSHSVQEHNSMDESFTINLGAQLKTTHNLRLTSVSVLDICRNNFGSKTVPTPQRIQTAMSLYSNSLSALVLLVDNRINSYIGIKRQFADICGESTDFHFADLEEQLEAVRDETQRKVGGGRGQNSQSNLLKVGDFYTTRHSNLSQVHVMFHLVCDDSLTSGDINSRHPVMLGLRNILKVAHLRDICTISLPLLLTHEMSDNMTLQWCLKRAELVFKCVKGFMIEMASLSPTDENRTVQFLVPKGISEELFSNLASMLPSIFRLSNPLVLQSVA